MTFPYPPDSKDWQTAYTRDMAFRDSEKYESHSLKLILLGLFTFACSLLWTYLFLFESYPLLLDWLLALPAVSLLLMIIVIALIFVLMFIFVVPKMAFLMASRFFIEFYRPLQDIDPDQVVNIINNRLSARIKPPPLLDSIFSPFGFVIISAHQIKTNQWPAWSARNLGGPFSLIVFDGFALYLERGNRFSRVVGPGDKFPFLERYETIKYIVDLRPKVQVGNCGAWTKDGIKVDFTIRVEFRIGDPAKHDPASVLVYPYDPEAVKKAVERCSVRWPDRINGQPSEFTWIDAAWGQVTGVVPGYVGSRMWDDLLIADQNGGQILSPTAVEQIFRDLNQKTNGFGVFVTDFQVLKIDIPKEVDERPKQYWKAGRQSIAAIIDGQAKASNIRIREKARADAQRDLILSIAAGLEKNKAGEFSEPVLLSFSSMLDESLKDPLVKGYLARDTLETLEQLQRLLNSPS